ncbi:MAG: hypothetical protein AAF205_07975 [Pseudomonadota bacterium]
MTTDLCEPPVPDDLRGLPLPSIVSTPCLQEFLGNFERHDPARGRIPADLYCDHELRQLLSGSAILRDDVKRRPGCLTLETPRGERYLLRPDRDDAGDSWTIEIVERLNDAERV